MQGRRRPKIIACGGRDEAYRDFCRALKDHSDAFAILLVDSEDPVPAGKTAIAYLRDRDHWTKPMPAKQVHLMVQCMEAWFLADKQAIAQYYGQEFQASALPANPEIEDIPKVDILNGLKRASKGAYHKTNHAFDILARIEPDAVSQSSNHAKDLFSLLLRMLLPRS